MASKIDWTEKVWEVTGGCTKCSPGCQECWAISQVWRMAHNPLLGDKWKGLVEKTKSGYNWTGNIKMFEQALNIPLGRKKPTTYFVDSKADLFHESVPFEFIDKVWDMARKCPQHTFQILTKRIKRVPDFLYQTYGKNYTPFKNLWLGVTICTPEEKPNIDVLRDIPAAIRFISFEPLLADMGEINLEGISWVIVGCESGPKHRPCDVKWVESIVRQCESAQVPCFVKQINILNHIYKIPKGWPQEYPK